jgi:aspartate/methionine/tyrosine aminotransferase
MKEHLSNRGQSLSRDMPALQGAHYAIQSNLYHPETNPCGYINMGTAESHLINDEVIAILSRIQCGLELTPHHIHYDYFHGSNDFRAAIAGYWGKVIFPETPELLTQKHIAVGAGCTIALENLATMLGDPGDVFLIPAPYYSSFDDDIHPRAGILPVPVHCGPELDTAVFARALAAEKAAGRRVRAILFSSPNNPVGTVYSPSVLDNLIAFCMANDLDIISDEIYAQTIHDPETSWVSTLSRVPQEYRHRVHVTTSFAKDFALSGFRTGFVISFNGDLIKGVAGLAYYAAVSTHTQALLTDLLHDPGVTALVQTNQTRLREAYERMTVSLNNLGIETLPAQGGIFLLANFSKYLDKQEFSAEFRLWEILYKELKINISPGQLFKTAAPGWFRICFAHPESVVAEACRRLETLSPA